jgi:acetolactate synthase I/II/III large subunit
MKLSNYIVKELEKHNVKVVFGYIGGNIADIIESIYLSEKIEFVVNYHEQASAFAANAYSQITGGIGVAVSSSGPGACNLINGIANAYFDSIPCLYITGNVHSKVMKLSNEIRQNGFQETDIVSIVKDITKFAVTVKNAEDIRYYLEKAIYAATQGRPGPVLLDIPYDIQRSKIKVENLHSFIIEEEIKYDEIDSDFFVELLKGSKKPLLLYGGGARSIKSKKLTLELLDKVQIPVVASLCGLDVVPHNHKCFRGFIGLYGNRYANLAISNCDLLIVIGSRLDERQIGTKKNEFAENARIIHVDIDKIELGRTIDVTQKIYTTAERFLEKMILGDYSDCNFSNWLLVTLNWRNRYPSFKTDSVEIDSNDFLHRISDFVSPNAIICADVGQNQMATAQAFHLDYKRRLLNSGGFGSMGYALPAAIGAFYAQKDSAIFCIVGDGGIQMNMQELQTIVRDKIPIHIIIINNQSLGMIERLQARLFNNRTYASIEGYTVPNFSKIAKSYGIDFLKIDSVEKYQLAKDFLNVNNPTIIELCLKQNAKNNPEPGENISKQNPPLSDGEIEKIKKESML